MSFANGEYTICKKKFSEGYTTKEIQDYLMEKYNCKRSKTSNFLKDIRKDMGIYCSTKPKFNA